MHKRIENKIDQYIAVIFYCLISFLILFYFKGHYILTLDMVFPLKAFFKDQFYGFSPPVFGGIALVASTMQLSIIPAWLLQKLYLFLIIFLSGISMHSLIKTESSIPKYFAGILYAVNPFTYVRFLAGHWFILLAYSIMPFAIKSFIDLLDNQDKRNLTKTILLTTLIGSINSHILVLIFTVYVILLIFKLYQIKTEFATIKNLFKSLGILALLFILLSLYWLLPVFTAKSSLIHQLSQADIYIFATITSAFNPAFTIASMHGFWREGYIYAKDLIPYWYLLFVFMLFLAIHGFINNYKSKIIGLPVKALAVVAVIAVILGSGIYGPFSSLFDFLFNNIFFFKGLRDSHKFAALLALSYSYLGALGVAEFVTIAKARGTVRDGHEKYKKLAAWAIVIAALITPFIYSFTMFNGFWGQLNPTDYPGDWYETNDLLNKDPQDFNILFMPWHQYMDFKWIPNAQKRIANPALNFFDKPVIQGENTQIGSIYSQSTNPAQGYVESLLVNRNNLTNFGELMIPLNVKYVLLTKEVDFKEYFFIFNQTDLELIKETENFYIFKNENRVAKIYQTDNIENIGDKEEVIYRTINPVRFEIGETNRKYLVFTVPYSQDWKLDGQEPVKAYGAVNAFENGGKEIRFERFYRINLPAYIISILTFVGLIAVYLGSGRKKKI